MAEETKTNPQPELLPEATASEQDGKGKDLALCSVCLQWTCDGPQCHRPGICEE